MKLNIMKAALFFTVLFNLYFPKGGIKVGGIPLTIGLFLLGMWLLIGFVSTLFKWNKNVLSYDRVIIVLSWMPFQMLVLFLAITNDVESAGMYFSMLFNFIFLPWMLLVFNGQNFDTKVDKEFLFKLFKYGVLFVAVFGLINFGYKGITGDYIEIPFLTSNYDDVGLLYEKDNARGDIGKLISTYQNGNLYGISLLMLLPLFCYLDKNTKHQFIVKLSIFLTLSRTVWVGLILYELLNAVAFSKIKIKNLFYMCIFFVVFIIGVSYIMDSIGLDPSFLLDSSLGGRLNNSAADTSWSWLPTEPIHGFSEIVYKGVIDVFGIVGIICFSIGFFSPTLLYVKNHLGKSPYYKAVFFGLFIYYVISMGDGAILLIPVMVFYWFLVLLLTGNSYVNRNIGL